MRLPTAGPVFGWLMLIAGTASAQVRRFEGKLEACPAPQVAEGALCGRLEVPEDRAASGGRTIGLRVVVFPATADSVASDPLAFLAGGGVVPATSAGAFLATAVPALRMHRDILLIDQRGSGGSNALACVRPPPDPERPPAEQFLEFIGRCRNTLSTRADLRHYNTSAAMHDLEAVRRWLGYPRLNLFGASYGTQAAQVYARQYPDRVRTMVLHGVVPLDVPMPLDLARSAQRTLEMVVGLCAQDSRCHAAFPSLRTALDSLSRARATGDPTPRELIVAALASTRGIAEVPRMLTRLARGDPLMGSPLSAPPGGGPPMGVRLAILCGEAMALVDTARIAEATAGTLTGDGQIRFQRRWCEGWPLAAIPRDFATPVASTVPTLLLTGSLDPTTPPAYAERVARSLSAAVHIVLAHRSHNDRDDCMMRLVESHVLAGGTGRGDAACAATPIPISFSTEP